MIKITTQQEIKDTITDLLSFIKLYINDELKSLMT